MRSEPPPPSSVAPGAGARREETSSCLLLVSHPDDDAIFAGELQRRTARHRWTVVCVTHGASSPRAAEMRAWQEGLGTPAERLVFLGRPDDPEDRRRGRCSIDAAAVATQVRALRLAPDLLVTHNERGEYGHPHHLLTHRVALAVFPRVPRLEFGHGSTVADLELPCGDKWPAVERAFASQREVVATFRRATETFLATPRAAALAVARRILE